jgi:hypothetical protein
MKDQFKTISVVTILVLLITTLNSCTAIEGIFKAGVWTGIIFVVIIIALIIFIISRIFKK